MNITILGAGNMGTAIAKLLGDNNHKVILWSIEDDVNKDINQNHKNNKYLQGVELKKDITATSNIEESLKNAELVVVSLPSNIVKSVIVKSSNFIPKKSVIVNTAKGLEDETDKRMSEVISDVVKNKIVSIGGPSIANEVALKVPTYVVFASTDSKALKSAVNAFKNEYYNITTTSDIIGVEWCSALKNIIAIATGIVDGLGYGDNTKAGIISMGLKELSEIVKIMGGDGETVHSLAGVGDLIVTCNSIHSRNRRFGEKLAKGFSVEEALKDVGQTVEGINAIKIVKKVIDKRKINAPLISKLYKVLFENGKAREIL
ncbi:Glycerol-3-phosphate dehydrogenase [NAD(P)+] [Candidatus Tiddalikarchaeum anstoanum]|nr:Glycerol-3-phosphate dehydrogenase [NAD(P)+] [Candidatus Tiddalikarchaeum anstoanum]